MYSEEDINSAVAAGALSTDAAASFRAHMTQLRDMPRSAEENFRFISSFNDIFVAIGAIIMLIAAGAIGQAVGGLVAPSPAYPVNDAASTWQQYEEQSLLSDGIAWLIGGVLVASTAWLLAEFFTRKRRMAFPSIILLVAFVGAVFAAVFGAGLALAGNGEAVGGFIASIAGLVAAGAAWLHWRRFGVPITIAAGVAAICVTVIGLIVALLSTGGAQETGDILLALTFVAGLAVFAFAMRWDMADRERTTRRSDVAFWLHLLAAPMIAHPVFYSLGIIDGGDAVNVGGALAVIAIYILFGLVALAVDRRALLVSALAYVLIALGFLIDRFGAVELTFALTALVIGSALLTLSAFWSPIRRAIVTRLPEALQDRLPPVYDDTQVAKTPLSA
ncbi:MAG: hypothetical protein WA948_12830 [Pontixanthobacter sp.]